MMMPSSGPVPPTPEINTSVPHSARMWNYWLGGKDNYLADQEAAEQFQAAFPQIAENARAFRAFLGRGVTYLAAEAGIRQFVDVGTGLPTENNTHELAQRVAPECRIVYVDNDPLVLAHARALLVGAPEGAPTTSTRTCANPRPSWRPPAGPSTSSSRSRSSSAASSAT